MPIDSLIRDDLERKKAQWEMGYETKELLRKVFSEIIDGERIMERIRYNINKEQFVSLRRAFDSLDWLGRGFLTTNEFKRACE